MIELRLNWDGTDRPTSPGRAVEDKPHFLLKFPNFQRFVHHIADFTFIEMESEVWEKRH